MKMKQLFGTLLLGLACMVPYTSQAQSFVYSPSPYVQHDIVGAANATIQVDITTASPENITFAWDKIGSSLPANWTYSICDYTGCYPPTVNTAIMTPLSVADMQGGMEAYMKLNLSVGTDYGQGTLQFWVYDVNDPNRGDTVTFDVNYAAPNSIGENGLKDFKAGPNPFAEQLNVKAGSQTTVLTVIDITGQVKFSTQLAAGQSKSLDLSALPVGIYLLQAEDAGGHVQTKKVVKR